MIQVYLKGLRRRKTYRDDAVVTYTYALLDGGGLRVSGHRSRGYRVDYVHAAGTWRRLFARP